MKKFSAFVLVAVMMFALAIPAMAIDVTINKGSPVIDGVRDDFYSGPFSIENKAQGDGTIYPANSANGNAWLAWSETSLYLYAEIYDKTPNNSGENEYNQDSAECVIDWKNAKGAGLGALIDADGVVDGVGTAEGYPFWQVRCPGNMHDSDFTELSGAMWFDMDWGGVEWACESHQFIVVPLDGDYKNGYVIEMKIDAPDMTLAEGQIIPFDIQINDNMDGEGRSAMTWMTENKGNGNQWCTPQACGVILTLGSAYVAPAEEAPPAVVEEGGGAAPEDAVIAPPPPVPAAPQVGDSAVMIIVFVIALAGAYAVTKRVIRNKA